RLRGEDLLGEVLGGISLGGGKARLRSRGRRVAKLGATSIAEAAPEGIDVTAPRAGQLQACTASIAEAGIRRILTLALGTLHHQPRVRQGYSRDEGASSAPRCRSVPPNSRRPDVWGLFTRGRDPEGPDTCALSLEGPPLGFVGPHAGGPAKKSRWPWAPGQV